MMRKFSASEQLAVELAKAIGSGRLAGELPGVNRLAEEWAVSRETARGALDILTNDGLITASLPGKPRQVIEVFDRGSGRKGLRIGFLLREGLTQESNRGFQQFVIQVKYRIELAGHVCVIPQKSQEDLGLDVTRILRLMKKHEVDAWLVAAGSVALLEHLSRHDPPTLAIGGRLKGLPIAGASGNPLETYRRVFKHLLDMGHRRITLINEPERKHPVPSLIEQGLRALMVERGIPFGEFNMPDWEHHPAGLVDLLDELFRLTPPTVIQATDWSVGLGVISYLNRKRLRIPDDVSLICESDDNSMKWHQPAIAHYKTDFEAITRRVMQWVGGIAKGKDDKRQVGAEVIFEPGGSIGPPRSRRGEL